MGPEMSCLQRDQREKKSFAPQLQKPKARKGSSRQSREFVGRARDAETETTSHVPRRSWPCLVSPAGSPGSRCSPGRRLSGCVSSAALILASAHSAQGCLPQSRVAQRRVSHHPQLHLSLIETQQQQQQQRQRRLPHPHPPHSAPPRGASSARWWSPRSPLWRWAWAV